MHYSSLSHLISLGLTSVGFLASAATAFMPLVGVGSTLGLSQLFLFNSGSLDSPILRTHHSIDFPNRAKHGMEESSTGDTRSATGLLARSPLVSFYSPRWHTKWLRTRIIKPSHHFHSRWNADSTRHCPWLLRMVSGAIDCADACLTLSSITTRATAPALRRLLICSRYVSCLQLITDHFQARSSHRMEDQLGRSRRFPVTFSRAPFSSFRF